MEASCVDRCPLVSRSPHSFSHAGAPCGWPHLAATCPECNREGEACTFFSDNVEQSRCPGLSRLVVLCLRCQLDGAKRRIEAQVRQRVIILSGGEGSQRAVLFATGHVKTYKDGLKLVEGVWLPQDIPTPETEFFWDRSVVPWRFSLTPRSGAEAVTMRGLLSALGIDGDAEVETQGDGELPDLATLAAQVKQLTQLVQTLVKAPAGSSGLANDNNYDASAGEAARLAEALRQARGNSHTPPSTQSWNPSQTFNLNTNSNASATVINNQSTDLEMMRLLVQSGASTDQIMRFMQSRAPATAPTEHRTAWLQVMEGMSPLCTYTGMQGETRQVVTPKSFTVQTYDALGNKMTLKITAWPPSKPETVAIFRLRELGNDWKRGLVQANTRLIQITPVSDRGLTPALPTNVDSFLDHCYTCLQLYDHTAVLRAWEATHLFMVDEYIAKRSQPSWDSIWMMPVFQVHLNGSATAPPRAADGVFDATKCCVSWNLKKGRNCVKIPESTCTKLHMCMRCGGEHRICDCTRE